MRSSFGYMMTVKGALSPLLTSAPPPPPPPARWTLIAFFLGFLLGIFVARGF